MRVLIVDDEQLARDRLCRMLEHADDCDVVGEARNGMEAVRMADELQPEVVLLDIRMPGMDGLEAAGHLSRFEQPPAIIFCTAYEEHAIAAFDLQAVGYLLKPVRKENLVSAIVKAQRLNRAQLAALSETDQNRRSHVSARTHNGIELIPVDSVRYFQADQKYVTVRHVKGELIIDETLRELEEEFGDLFVRIHRGALVAKRHIEGLTKNREGQFKVRMGDIDEMLEVSRRHLSSVRKLVKSL